MNLALETLFNRNPIHYDKVAKVLEYFNKKVDIYPDYYFVDKPNVAFVLRFNNVAFHIKFNVTSDDEPEDTITDIVCYTVQDFNNYPSISSEYDEFEPAINHLITLI